jgi:hypothetical protein
VVAVKRAIIVWAVGLVMLPFVGAVPAAEATGAGVCTVTGTITFSAGSLTATGGAWAIGPAVISCQGLFNGYERILGSGSFAGSGTYKAFPDGTGTCLRNVGTGTLDYRFRTSQADIRLIEQGTYTLAGAGAFMTPSLRGTFKVAPLDGDCVTRPVTTAVFVAEATLVRFAAPDPNRLRP